MRHVFAGKAESTSRRLKMFPPVLDAFKIPEYVNMHYFPSLHRFKRLNQHVSHSSERSLLCIYALDPSKFPHCPFLHSWWVFDQVLISKSDFFFLSFLVSTHTERERKETHCRDFQQWMWKQIYSVRLRTYITPHREVQTRRKTVFTREGRSRATERVCRSGDSLMIFSLCVALSQQSSSIFLPSYCKQIFRPVLRIDAIINHPCYSCGA